MAKAEGTSRGEAALESGTQPLGEAITAKIDADLGAAAQTETGEAAVPKEIPDPNVQAQSAALAPVASLPPGAVSGEPTISSIPPIHVSQSGAIEEQPANPEAQKASNSAVPAPQLDKIKVEACHGKAQEQELKVELGLAKESQVKEGQGREGEVKKSENQAGELDQAEAHAPEEHETERSELQTSELEALSAPTALAQAPQAAISAEQTSALAAVPVQPIPAANPPPSGAPRATPVSGPVDAVGPKRASPDQKHVSSRDQAEIAGLTPRADIPSASSREVPASETGISPIQAGKPEVLPAAPEATSPGPLAAPSGAPARIPSEPAAQVAAPPIRVVSDVPLGAVPVEIGMKSLAGINHFEIRLDPVELGRIEVRLDIDQEGGVKAHLSVDRVETLALLQRDARTLERAFDQAGLKLSEGSIDLSLRDQQAQGHGRHEHAGDQRREAFRQPGPDMRRGEAEPAFADPPPRLWRGSASVDLLI